MAALLIVVSCSIVVVMLVAIELRLRGRKRAPVKIGPREPREPRRLPHVEERVRDVLADTKQRFGPVFVDYKVWRMDREMRLELEVAPLWKRLSDFTRCLVIRQLWRTLEEISGGAVVVVDAPPLRWTKDVDSGFRARGADPWLARYATATAPQYIKTP